MVTVLQTWDAESKHRPPPGLTADSGSSITIMARAKLSYAPPNLPLTWIRRTGFRFEHITELRVSPDQARQERAEQVLRFLDSELKAGRHYSSRALDESARRMGLTRAQVKETRTELEVCRRVFLADLPKELRHGRKTTYLCPAHCAKPAGAIDPETPSNGGNSGAATDTRKTASFNAPDYRDGGIGAIAPMPSPPRFLPLRQDQAAQCGAIGAIAESGTDEQPPGTAHGTDYEDF